MKRINDGLNLLVLRKESERIVYRFEDWQWMEVAGLISGHLLRDRITQHDANELLDKLCAEFAGK